MSSFIKHLERIRTKESLNLQQDEAITYLGSAFDLCQRVEGARRFIAAHEIGHVCLFAQKASALVFKQWIDEELEALAPDLAEVPAACRDNWWTEFWSDTFSTIVLFMGLLEEHKRAYEQHDPRLIWIANRIINTALGIVLLFKQYTYFDLLRFVNSKPERNLDSYDRDVANRRYPPAELRLNNICRIIRQLCPWAIESARSHVFFKAINDFEEMVTSFFDIEWSGTDEPRLVDPERVPTFRQPSDIDDFLKRFNSPRDAVDALNKLKYTTHDLFRLLQPEFQFQFCQEWQEYKRRS